MRQLIVPAALLAMLAACGPPAPPAPPPAPPPKAAKPAAKKPAAKPKPPPEPKKPVSKAPTLPDFEVTARTKGLPEGFADVQKNMEGKYFEQALEALGPKLTEAKRGQLVVDEKMLVYSIQGFAFAMQNEPTKAKGSYRRILPIWGNWRKKVKQIKAVEKDAAKADSRIAMAVDTVGEALFYLAEDKRGKIDQVALGAYSGGSDPREVHQYLDKKVKRFADGRAHRIKKAQKDYDKVLKLEPVVPGRWAVASASRIGAFHAQVLEELRDLIPPDDWKTEGKSEFKETPAAKEPLEWKAIQDKYKAAMDELKAPVKERAKVAYEACVATGTEHKVADTDPFLKSCKDWLAANE